MANRAPSLDPHVFSIRDLERQGSSRLPLKYRGQLSASSVPLQLRLTKA